MRGTGQQGNRRSLDARDGAARDGRPYKGLVIANCYSSRPSPWMGRSSPPNPPKGEALRDDTESLWQLEPLPNADQLSLTRGPCGEAGLRAAKMYSVQLRLNPVFRFAAAGKNRTG